MILYANAISNYAAKVRIVLGLKGLAFEETLPPDGYGSAAYKRIVPMGTIPALLDGALVISESETIAEYLEDAYPDPPLLPFGAAARARVRFLARFHDLYLEPPLRAMFGHLTPSRRQPALVADQVARFARRLAELDGLADPAGPFLTGPLSLADCGFPATIALAQAMLPPLGAAYEPGPVMAAWEAQADAHPVLGPNKSAYRAAAERWAAAKLAA